jgi:4-hydroxy-tetrahydrodipicolinate synthase
MSAAEDIETAIAKTGNCLDAIRGAGRPYSFGRVLTAMVTPFTPDGDELDRDAAALLANRLLDLGNDGLVVNGITGEAATTSDAEKADLLRVVVNEVGARATIIAGVGADDTAHSVRLARQAADLGAHGLLVGTPCDSRPPQSGLIAHFTAVADASGLPVMLHDIPPLSVVALDAGTLHALSMHPKIVAVKAARDDLHFGAEMIATTGLSYYSGDDGLSLAFIALGAVGCVSVIGHVVADRLRDMIDAFERGDVHTARALHDRLLPVYRAMRRVDEAAFAKIAVDLTWCDVGPTRLPLPPPTAEQIAAVAADLAEADVPLSGSFFCPQPEQHESPAMSNSGVARPVLTT